MFSKKSIRVEVQKISGNYTPFSGTYSFSDLPIEVRISKTKIPAGYSASINIYGISKQKMDSITTIGWKTGMIDEITVCVYANDGDGEHLLFQGQVMSALPNYSNAPDVCISITACAGAFHNIKTDVPPSSVLGENVPAPKLFEKICNDYGVTLINKGVKDVYCGKNPRIDGDGLTTRISKAAKAYGIDFFINNNSVTIYKKGSKDYIGQKEKLKWDSKDYIGYPSFNNAGIELKFDRVMFALELGNIFIIKNSNIDLANDTWFITKITYDLSTRLGGKWIMGVCGTRVIPGE